MHQYTNGDETSAGPAPTTQPPPTDERTPLVRPDSTWSVPHGGHAGYTRRDHRLWVRWPVESFHVTYATLASSYVNVLLVFVPLGIAAG
ncbi:hypothetical protein KEM55_001796, partial [Ascosphaera atra]